jgi:uncharacterized protein YjbI with pentapeptide repeats
MIPSRKFCQKNFLTMDYRQQNNHMNALSFLNLSLPKDILTSVISFLSPEQQLLDRRVSQTWLKASKARLCEFALMRSITKLPKGERNLFLKGHLGLIQHLGNLNFHSLLDPNSKFKREFLSKVTESKLEEGSLSVITYLQSLSEKQRGMIETLEFSCDAQDFTDEHIAEMLALCPRLKSLTLINSQITGVGLAQILEGNQLESLYLDCCENLDEDALANFFLKTPDLKEVKFFETNIKGRCLAEIPEGNHIEKFVLHECDYPDEDDLAIFFSKATFLRELDLSYTLTAGGCLADIPEENHLEKLSLSLSSHDPAEDDLAVFFSKATHLREVILSSTSISGRCLAQIPEENHIEKILLNSCHGLDEDFLVDFFSKATHLREVILSSTNISGRCLTQIPEENHIEKLLLKLCENLSEDALADFLSKAAHLRKIDLSSTNITGKCLTHIPEKNYLEKLDLNYCQNLIECFLAGFFFQKMANLKEVNFYAANITGEGLSFIAKKNRLERINLQECDNLKKGFLSPFFSKTPYLKEIKFSKQI